MGDLGHLSGILCVHSVGFQGQKIACDRYIVWSKIGLLAGLELYVALRIRGNAESGVIRIQSAKIKGITSGGPVGDGQGAGVGGNTGLGGVSFGNDYWLVSWAGLRI